MKAAWYSGIRPTLLTQKTLAMVFSKPSTRTRVSFEVAMTQLGGHALYLGTDHLQMGRGETIADTARVLSGYCDGIMIRTYAHKYVEELSKFSRVPVINGLTDLVHPVQVFADLLTIKEKCGRLEGIKLAFFGDGNNVANSLMLGGAKMGMEVRIVCAKGYEPNPDVVKAATEDAALYGGRIVVTDDVNEGASGVDVVYTDVWTSMGQEEERDQRREALRSYQVNSRVMSKAAPTAIFMHCLPAHRGEEVTADVADGPRSVIFDEAENRLHAEKALLALVL